MGRDEKMEEEAPGKKRGMDWEVDEGMCAFPLLLLSGAEHREEKLVKILIVAIKGY